MVFVPISLSKLSDVVRNDVFKKTVYFELVKKIKAIHTKDTNHLVEKADYNARNC